MALLLIIRSHPPATRDVRHLMVNTLNTTDTVHQLSRLRSSFHQLLMGITTLTLASSLPGVPS